MKAHRIAWLGLGLIGAVISLTAACSSADEANATSTGAAGPSGSGGSGPVPECGNSTVEVGEQCDDGNSDEADGCDMSCRLPVCGNGIAQQGEECDDGDTDNNNACSNRCEVVNKNCGNNTLEPNLGEECDDGNDVQNDDCTNTCTLPQCGDGIVQEGEDCDDGNSEQNDMCPSTCQLDGVTTTDMGPGPGGAGGNPPVDCDEVAIYSGLAVKGAVKLHPSVWSYQGNIGTAAGNAMCKDIGADHVCTYEEVVLAGQKGELSNAGVANDTSKLNAEIGQGANSTAWLHRLTPVMAVGCPGGTCQPGAGARCNDWTYPTDHIADGEYTKVGTGANGLAFSLDKDPVYTGIASDGHTDKTDGRNCAGRTRAIMCCFPTCKE